MRQQIAALFAYCKKPGVFNANIIFISTSILIFIALNLTVHSNTIAEVEKAHSFLPMMQNFIETWIREGYLKHGGLYYNGYDISRTWHPEPYYYNAGVTLLAPYLLQKINYIVTGHSNIFLLALSNQIIVMIGAIFLSLLSWRMAEKSNPDNYNGNIAIALSCLIVFQTFPQNIFFYWFPSPQSLFLIFFLPFLFFMDYFLSKQFIRSKKSVVFLFALIFLMMLSERVAATLSIASLLIAMHFMDTESVKKKMIILTSILAGSLVVILGLCQSVLAKRYHPGVEILGSGAVVRTGFDGSTLHYNTHWDLLFSRHPSMKYPTLGSLGDFLSWKALFIVGVVAVIFILYQQFKKPNSIFPILFSFFGTYLLYAFIFSNAVVLHTDLYDVFIFTPIALSVFGIVPIYVFRYFKNNVWTCVSFLMAICYTAVQIRSYATTIPLPPA
ncbi:MAG: hypothetical protein KKD92_16210 [Proteobacteria bacterium]|nr:hypothetical protein [Pseudomonadota bacterium]